MSGQPLDDADFALKPTQWAASSVALLIVAGNHTVFFVLILLFVGLLLFFLDEQLCEGGQRAADLIHDFLDVGT